MNLLNKLLTENIQKSYGTLINDYEVPSNVLDQYEKNVRNILQNSNSRTDADTDTNNNCLYYFDNYSNESTIDNYKKTLNKFQDFLNSNNNESVKTQLNSFRANLQSADEYSRGLFDEKIKILNSIDNTTKLNENNVHNPKLLALLYIMRTNETRNKFLSKIYAHCVDKKLIDPLTDELRVFFVEFLFSIVNFSLHYPRITYDWSDTIFLIPNAVFGNGEKQIIKGIKFSFAGK